MALSPIDVQQKAFRPAFKGYDGDEVDEFLDEVVVTLREYEERLREADDKVAVLEDQLRSRADSDDSIKRAFVSAQKAADELIDNAKVEADAIIARAREEAAALTESQAGEKARLLAKLDRLRETTHDLVAKLREAAAEALEPVHALEGEVEEATAEFGAEEAWQTFDEDAAATAEGGAWAEEPDAPDANEADDAPMSRFNRTAVIDVEPRGFDDAATEEVPTLRRPWERNGD